MFLVITKWTPLEQDARYLNFITMAEISRSNNLKEDGTHFINPSYYDKEIFDTWIESVTNFRDYLIADTNFIYNFLEKEDSNIVYTVQGFMNKEPHDRLSTSDVYITHQSKRESLNQLLKIQAEIKKIEADVPTDVLSDYIMVEAFFDHY